MYDSHIRQWESWMQEHWPCQMLMRELWEHRDMCRIPRLRTGKVVDQLCNNGEVGGDIKGSEIIRSD